MPMVQKELLHIAIATIFDYDVEFALDQIGSAGAKKVHYVDMAANEIENF